MAVLNTYGTPMNCQSMLVPKMNAPIWDVMTMSIKNIDIKIQKMQEVLVKGMIAMT